MKIIRSVASLRRKVAEAKNDGKSIGLVPTMGALHAGHISLVDRARAENDVVVVSVFVNPTQFNNANDLATYPRTEEADCEKLEAAGVDFAFIPSVKEVYPKEDTRQFDLGAVAEVMEGAMRPGHFNGVCQIVSKLFAFVQPTRAYFGEKDFQQIAVIRRMVELEGFDLEIVACPIKREDDGLAKSSRNTYLNAAERAAAPVLYRAIQHGKSIIKKGMPSQQLADAMKTVLAAEPLAQTEYVAVVDAMTMQPVDTIDRPVLVPLAVRVGSTRLIDNFSFAPEA